MSHCLHNLKQIGLALHNYHDTYGSFPPAYVADEHGQPMHSWRVLLLPWLDEKKLYESYHFDEPWNSEANRSLTERTPAPFACPSTHRHERYGRTSYMAIVGRDTLWPGTTSRQIADVTDGIDSTLAVIEVPDRDVLWTEPRDITFDDAVNLFADVPTRNAEGAYQNYNMLLADGSVATNSITMPEAVWRAWFTIAGDDAPEIKMQPRVSERDIRPHVRDVAYWAFVVLMVVPLPIVWRRR